MSVAPPRPKGEVKDFPCPDCGAFMALKWSWRREQWFYGCATWPVCDHTFNAHWKTGAPQPGQNPPDLLKKPKKKRQPQLTLWDVLREMANKYAVGAAIDHGFAYWNGENTWTTHHAHVRLYDSRAQAEEVLQATGGDFIEDIGDEAAFRIHEDTW